MERAPKARNRLPTLGWQLFWGRTSGCGHPGARGGPQLPATREISTPDVLRGAHTGLANRGFVFFVLRVSRMREPCKKKESFANPLFASPVCAPPKFTIEKLRFVRFVPPAIAVPRGRWRSVYIPFTERGRRTLFTGWGEGGGQQFVRNRVANSI